jgi:hypothetical protein
LIDTISLGYRALNRRIWLIILPITLSAYLWFGTPIMLDSALNDGSALNSLPGVAELSGVQQEIVRTVLTSDLRLNAVWLNLVPLLTPPQPPPTSTALLVSSPLMVLVSILLLNTITLLLSSLFLTGLSGAVRNDPLRPLSELRLALRVAWTLVRVLLALLGVGIVLGLPFFAISAILIAILPAAALPVFLLWYIAIFWAYIYVGFVPEAILLSQKGPLRAVYNSVNLVRRNLAATLGLLLVSMIITSGLAVLWRQLATNPFGIALALLGSAYVGSGLSAARMEFYRERLARWKRAV